MAARKDGKPKKRPDNLLRDRFAKEMPIDLNMTKAAIRAGYAPESARQAGSRLMSDDDMKMKVQEQLDLRAKRTEITADKVLVELAKMAFVNAADLFDEDGKLLPVKQMPRHLTASIASLEVVSSGDPDGESAPVTTHKIKFWDKRGSLELLGKHLKLFADKIELSGPDEGPVQVQDATDYSKLDRAELKALAEMKRKLKSNEGK